jgi:hypothetical protein
MKHLKSSLRDLRQVFDRSISVRYLAEPFVSFDAQRHAPEVRTFMEARDFDIVGVRQNGAVVGCVCRADLQEDTLAFRAGVRLSFLDNLGRATHRGQARQS